MNVGLLWKSSSCRILLHCAPIKVSEEVKEKEKLTLRVDPLLNRLESGSLARKAAYVGEWAHFLSLPADSYLMT